MADVAMGFLFVRQSLQPAAVFICLLGASSLLYIAGMILNDVYDFDLDVRQRPHRPLPSGRISVAWARWLGYEMLLCGVALGWLAGYIFPAETALSWRSGVVATALAVCIVLYDAGLKQTLVGPLAMGACRFFNVLLGMSAAAVVMDGRWWSLGYSSAQLLVAGGIGLYIAGVTWFARTEASESSRLHLAAGIGVMAAGIVLLSIFPHFPVFPAVLRFHSDVVWPLLLCLLGVTILRRCGAAVASPTPENVQAAVKLCILSLIMLDASVCLAISDPYYALVVLALLLPTLLLGKWVYST
jgi:4-hydroxybenzoate polyprenyltransferase